MNNFIVYHGTPQKHEFNEVGRMFEGTFFSTSKNEANTYGNYVYSVTLKKDLNLFDTNLLTDCKLLISEFGPLIDPYYNPNDISYYITEPEQIYHNSDSWSIIEGNYDVLEWLGGNYDGVWVYEGGVRNLLLFKPINDKIEDIVLLMNLKESIRRILREELG